MISDPLFRVGDEVHFRDDLAPNLTYRMFHKPWIESTTHPSSEEWCAQYRGTEVLIDNNTTGDRYCVAGFFGVCDEMFAEAVRIVPYLVNSGRAQRCVVFDTSAFDPFDDVFTCASYAFGG